tara:strand:+ start:95 stop:295 length:201 start_codon:yes stop_codon:yes gene_type:complete
VKIKDYKLRIIIDGDDDEILHLSEKYDCPDSDDYKYKLEIMGVLIDVPKDLVKYLNELDNEELGLA